MALTIYESSLCSCGHPVSRAYNLDMEGYYEKVEHLCQACRVAQEAQADERAEPGRKVAIVDRSYDEGFEPNPSYLGAT
ncbi:MAG: hypothetical protein ACTHQ3_15770 [Motilibacteraceae bacterium]